MNVIPDMVDQGELHTVHEDLNEDSREDIDRRETLPPGEVDNETPLTPEEVEKLYDQFEMEDDVNYKFDRILDYAFKDRCFAVESSVFG
jgi:transcriptional/translational regulatory protein YebC/TACO1